MATSSFAAALARREPLLIDGGLATQLEAQGCDISNHLWSASLLLDQPDAIVDSFAEFKWLVEECLQVGHDWQRSES